MHSVGVIDCTEQTVNRCLRSAFIANKPAAGCKELPGSSVHISPIGLRNCHDVVADINRPNAD